MLYTLDTFPLIFFIYFILNATVKLVGVFFFLLSFPWWFLL